MKLSEWVDTFGGDTERVEQALQLELKLHLIQQVIDDYLLRGEGGGGRRICLRIQKILTDV